MRSDQPGVVGGEPGLTPNKGLRELFSLGRSHATANDSLAVSSCRELLDQASSTGVWN